MKNIHKLIPVWKLESALKNLNSMYKDYSSKNQVNLFNLIVF